MNQPTKKFYHLRLNPGSDKEILQNGFDYFQTLLLETCVGKFTTTSPLTREWLLENITKPVFLDLVFPKMLPKLLTLLHEIRNITTLDCIGFGFSTKAKWVYTACVWNRWMYLLRGSFPRVSRLDCGWKFFNTGGMSRAVTADRCLRMGELSNARWTWSQRTRTQRDFFIDFKSQAQNFVCKISSLFFVVIILSNFLWWLIEFSQTAMLALT